MTVIASGLVSPSTNYNNGKKIVVDTHGIIYMCFYAQINSKYQIFVYKSEDKGNSWINMNFPQISGKDQYYPSIAIDSNDKVHVVWIGLDNSNNNYQIKYSNNTSGSWSSWINIQTISEKSQSNPSIAIDSKDKVHVVWHGLDSSNPSYNQIKYSNNISGLWSSWINIQPLSGNTQQYPSIIINKGTAHIIWSATDGTVDYYSIKLIMNKYLLKDGSNACSTDGTILNIVSQLPFTIDLFNQYGIDDLSLLNSTVISKVLNDKYNIALLV